MYCTLVIYLKGNYLEPQTTTFFPLWAIKSMISNLNIGNGCLTISIHFKNRLFGLPGTFLGRYTHASLHHVYGRKGFHRVSPSDSRRLQPMNRFPVMKSRHTIFLDLLLQTLQKNIPHRWLEMYIPGTLWWPLFCVKFGPCFSHGVGGVGMMTFLNLHTCWILRNCVCLVLAHMLDATQLRLSCHCTHAGYYVIVFENSLIEIIVIRRGINWKDAY